MLHVESKDFNDAISTGTVIVDFSAMWCGPCKMLTPILEQFNGKNTDIKIIKIDVDAQPDLAGMFNVTSIPTLVLFKDGKQIDIRQGFMTEDMLNEWIKGTK
jgi:thioredoxin 1